jgi:hypothetical protein
MADTCTARQRPAGNLVRRIVGAVAKHDHRVPRPCVESVLRGGYRCTRRACAGLSTQDQSRTQWRMHVMVETVMTWSRDETSRFVEPFVNVARKVMRGGNAQRAKSRSRSH